VNRIGIEKRHVVSAETPACGKQPAQTDKPVNSNGRGWKASTAAYLQRTVGVEYLGPDTPGIGMGGKKRKKGIERIF